MEEPQGAPTTPSGPVVAQRSLLNIFARRWWIIVVVTVSVFAAAGLTLVVQPKVYRATVLILLKEPTEQTQVGLRTPAELFSEVESALPIQLRLMRRYETAQKVKQTLGLALDARAILGGITVDRFMGTRQTNLVALNYDDTDPERTQQVADEWARVYAEESKARGTETVDAALAFIGDQLGTVDTELTGVETDLLALGDGPGAMGTEGSGTEALSALEASLASNGLQTAATNARIQQAQALVADEPELKEQTREQPTELAAAMQDDLARLQLLRQEKLETYRQDTPEVRALDERIQKLEDDLASLPGTTKTVVGKVSNEVIPDLEGTLRSLQGELAAQEAQRKLLEQRIAEQEATGDQLPDSLLEAARLRRRQRILETRHSMLLTRQFELELDKAMEAPTAQVVQAADLPTVPIKPQPKTMLGIGLVLGLLLGITVAAVVDQIEDTFADFDEMAAHTGKRLLGAIPHLREMGEQPLAAFTNTRSHFSNSVRMTASNLRFLMGQNGGSSLVITSAGRAEGKTTIVANVAAALAASGEKVLLIDADLHKPNIHRILDLPNDVGLSSVLVGAVSPEDVVQPTEVEGLQVITSGPRSPSPTDLLATDQSAELLGKINALADVVLWDTPPAGVLPDAAAVAGQASATIFIVGRGAKRRAVRHTLSGLEGMGITIPGLVANQARPGGGYYYYYYYYDSYHSYGSDEDADAEEN